MIGRLLSAVLFAALAYALPLVGSGSLGHDFRPWLAMTSALLLVFAQPTLSREEARLDTFQPVTCCMSGAGPYSRSPST